MQAGREVKLRRGALWACALPAVLGGLYGVFATIEFLNNEREVYIMRAFEFLVVMNLVLCLICIPALAAWLTGFCLRRIDDPNKLGRWRTCFGRALLCVTTVQFIAAIIFAALLSTTFDQIYAILAETHEKAGNPPRTRSEINPIIFSMKTHLRMWIALTLPLTVIGATIFHRVTKFPSDRTVF